MKIKEISKSRGKKVSMNYKSKDYHIGITVETEEDDELDDVNHKVNDILNELSISEEIRINVFIEAEKSVHETSELKGTRKANLGTKVIETDSNALPEKNFTAEPNNTIEEEVIMDLTEVSVVAVTDKSILVTKKGYQKWVAYSMIEGYTEEMEFERQDYLEDIVLAEKHPVSGKSTKWFHKKPWVKLQIKKGGS